MAKIDLNQLMSDIVHINNQLNGLNLLLKNKKQLLGKYFQKSGNRRVDGDEVTAYEQTRTKVEYNVPKILAKLPKSTTSLFIDKHYEITDWAGFVALCKANCIKPEKLRQYIRVSSEVNQTKLSVLYDKGKVTLSDLDGCYEATVTKSIALKFKNVDKEIPITE